MPKYYKPNNSTILYLNSSFNCAKTQTINLSIKNGGSGYTSAPTIAIAPALGDSGGGASATCTVSGGVVSTVTVTNNGFGYTKTPVVTLSGGGNPGVITGYSALNGGTGYITAPTLSVTGGGGSGFSGTCILNTQTLNHTYNHCFWWIFIHYWTIINLYRRWWKWCCGNYNSNFRSNHISKYH